VTNDKRVEEIRERLSRNRYCDEDAIHFLLSELDRAKKLLTLAVGVMANESELTETAFKTLTECREYVASAAPTENKSNGR
jgi:hypothetical protein